MSKTLLDADFRGNTTLPTKPVIKLASPTTTGVLLVWAPSSWAASYEIVCIEGIEVKLVAKDLKQTFFEIPLATLKKEPQVFMIRAVNQTGPGNWSTPITLTTAGELSKLKLFLKTAWKQVVTDARVILGILCVVILCEVIIFLGLAFSTWHVTAEPDTHQPIVPGSTHNYTPPLPAGYLTDEEFNASEKRGGIPSPEKLAEFDSNGRQPVEEAYYLPAHGIVTFNQCYRSDISVTPIVEPRFEKNVQCWFNRKPDAAFDPKIKPEVTETVSFRNNADVPVSITFLTRAYDH